MHGINEKPEQGLTTGVNDTSNNVSPVTTTPVIIFPDVVDTNKQLMVGVDEYLHEFSYKFYIAPKEYSGALGKLFMIKP